MWYRLTPTTSERLHKRQARNVKRPCSGRTRMIVGSRVNNFPVPCVNKTAKQPRKRPSSWSGLTTPEAAAHLADVNQEFPANESSKPSDEVAGLVCIFKIRIQQLWKWPPSPARSGDVDRIASAGTDISSAPGVPLAGYFPAELVPARPS